MLKVYCRAVALDRLVAVSDAQYPAGMPPGEYDVFGAKATVPDLIKSLLFMRDSLLLVLG